MKDQLQRVLERIVVPQYVDIEDVLVSKIGESEDYLQVTYYTNQKLKGKKMVEVTHETVGLWKMLSPELKSDIFVNFVGISDGPDVEVK